MAEQQPSKDLGLQQHPLVDRLVPDPSQVPADVIQLAGFLGKSTQQGYWRLYLTQELNEYVEVAEADIVHSHSNANDQNPLGGTLLWIKRAATLQHTRIESRQVEAEFLQGDITGGMLFGQFGQAAPFVPHVGRLLPNVSLFCSRFCSRFCSNICSAAGLFAPQVINTCTHPFSAACCS